jgi:Na+/H+-dicarboxylate symporter
MRKHTKPPWAVFAAIVLAMFIGNWSGTTKDFFGVTFYALYDLFGTLFLNTLMFVVVPLVSSSIITGVARIGSESAIGRLGAKTFAFYLGTSLLAILIGLLFVNLIAPGVSEAVQESRATCIEAFKASPQMLSTEAHSVAGVLLSIIPANILDAFSKNQMLAVIFFSLIFGYSVARIEAHPSSILIGFWQGLFQVMLRITHLVMRFLPFGVFCLVAKVFATTGLESLKYLGLFLITVLLSLAVFMFGALPLLLKLFAKVDPFLHVRAMSPALITAFSTSSSSATLPITIDCVEKRSGVSNKICSLVVPLGTSINMSGSALYECVAAMFVAQAYGIEISFLTQFLVVFLALLTSVGVAGIPSASLVAIMIILKAIGLPAEGIGLFIAVDRLLDMCRTTVNVFSDSCCAVLVAKTEGEKNVLANRELPPL